MEHRRGLNMVEGEALPGRSHRTAHATPSSILRSMGFLALLVAGYGCVAEGPTRSARILGIKGSDSRSASSMIVRGYPEGRHPSRVVGQITKDSASNDLYFVANEFDPTATEADMTGDGFLYEGVSLPTIENHLARLASAQEIALDDVSEVSYFGRDWTTPRPMGLTCTWGAGQGLTFGTLVAEWGNGGVIVASRLQCWFHASLLDVPVFEGPQERVTGDLSAIHPGLLAYDSLGEQVGTVAWNDEHLIVFSKEHRDSWEADAWRIACRIEYGGYETFSGELRFLRDRGCKGHYVYVALLEVLEGGLVLEEGAVVSVAVGLPNGSELRSKHTIDSNMSYRSKLAKEIRDLLVVQSEGGRDLTLSLRY